MKGYKKPQIVSINKESFFIKKKNSIFPSMGALKGAAYMVARSAAKGGQFLEYQLPTLQKLK